MTSLILKSWTDGTGRERRYVNNLAEVIGLEYDTYNTGNIIRATFKGEVIANAAAKRILGAKVWLDQDDKVHVDYWYEHYVITAEQVKKIVAEIYSAQQSADDKGAASEDPMPVFVIKAKDDLAYAVVEHYRDTAASLGLDEQAREVDKALQEIVSWRQRNPDQCKMPDHKHVPVNGKKEDGKQAG